MVTEPESMEELAYMTNRSFDPGSIRVWVYRQDCPACGKAKMGKPVVKGKVKIRAKEFVCPECGHTVEKEEYEETLTAEAVYECPHCGKEGEASIPFKRKKVKGVDILMVPCEHCGKIMDVTKKMKDKKD